MSAYRACWHYYLPKTEGNHRTQTEALIDHKSDKKSLPKRQMNKNPMDSSSEGDLFQTQGSLYPPVKMISTSESTALRSIGLSIMSRIRLSSSTGLSGVSTISIGRREFEMNDSKAGSLSGNFFVKMRFISSRFCSQIAA